MEANTKESDRTTRSGRKISGAGAGAGSKRKRQEDVTETDGSAAKKKMPNEEKSLTEQIEQLKVFFETKLDEGLKNNREGENCSRQWSYNLKDNG